MPRDYKASENRKRSAERRAHALARVELRQPTVPRESAAGATSAAIKITDPADQDLIAAFLAKKEGNP